MKERMLDVIKWWLIIAFGAVAFYVVFPKYHFPEVEVRANKITGKVEWMKRGVGQNRGEWKNIIDIPR